MFTFSFNSTLLCHFLSSSFFVIRYSLFVWRVIFYGLKGSFLSSFIPPYFKWFENPSSSSENVLASFVKLIVCLLLAQVIAQELEKGSEKKSSQVFFSTTRPRKIVLLRHFMIDKLLLYKSNLCPIIVNACNDNLAASFNTLNFITLQLHSKHLNKFFENRVFCFN